MICSIRIRVRFGQTLLAACKSCYFRRVFKAKEKQDGNPTKSPDELTQEPQIVTWPEMHYVFIEKIGPFQNTAPQAWQEVHPLFRDFGTQQNHGVHEPLQSRSKALSRRGSLAAEPKNLPANLTYRNSKAQVQPFVLTGSYANCRRLLAAFFEIVAEKKIQNAR